MVTILLRLHGCVSEFSLPLALTFSTRLALLGVSAFSVTALSDIFVGVKMGMLRSSCRIELFRAAGFDWSKLAPVLEFVDYLIRLIAGMLANYRLKLSSYTTMSPSCILLSKLRFSMTR